MTLSHRQGQVLGWVPTGPGNTGTTQLSATANWFAISFVPDAARTLSAVRAFVSAVAGTLAGSDITCDLYDSAGTNGVPGSSIETGKLPTATITASGWYNFTGFTTSLTANQQYWAVFKNTNGTPASNNATFRAVNSISSPATAGSAVSRLNWATASSTNSGSTWATVAQRSAVRIAYADGTYDGMPASNVAQAVVGDGVYSSRESGIKFTSPSNGVLKVAGIALYVAAKTGSPTGAPRFGLWTGGTPSLLAYTNSLPTTAITTSQWVYSYFASTQTIQPGTICRVTLGETTQSDASGSRWNMQEVTWDADANSVILLPWNGTATKTYFDGSNWTESALGTSLFGHALLLDTVGEFSTPNLWTGKTVGSIGTY